MHHADLIFTIMSWFTGLPNNVVIECVYRYTVQSVSIRTVVEYTFWLSTPANWILNETMRLKCRLPPLI